MHVQKGPKELNSFVVASAHEELTMTSKPGHRNGILLEKQNSKKKSVAMIAKEVERIKVAHSNFKLWSLTSYHGN